MTKRGEIVCLALATSVSMAAALASMVLAILSPIAFDKAGSLFNPLGWLAFLMMISLWVVCIIGPFAAWVMFGRGKIRQAWLWMAAPIPWALIMALLLLILE